MVKTELKKKKVYFSHKLPSHSRLLSVLEYPGEKKAKASKRDTTLLVICDRKLQSHPEVVSWLENYLVYFVSGGEEIKNLDSFSGHIHNILKMAGGKKIIGFISLGGGSIGDFTGFLASVYKRGGASYSYPQYLALCHGFRPRRENSFKCRRGKKCNWFILFSSSCIYCEKFTVCFVRKREGIRKRGTG